jgi:Fibronectin type III domain
MKVILRVVTAAAVALAIPIVTAYAATPAPSKVNSLKATAGDTQVTLSWSSPTIGKPLTGYTVTASPGGYSTTDTSEPRTVQGLNNGTLYTFTVYATNASGSGVKSTITATPHATPPSAPTNLGATQIGPGSIRLDWTPPASNGSTPPGGSPPDVQHYTVTISPGGTSTQVPPSTLTYTANGLADNVTYTFSVSATNTRSLTGPAAVVYAPLPTDATIGLQPTAGVITIAVTVTGQNFLKNESLTLYWDLTTHPAATLVTDDNGAFTKGLKPRPLDKPGVHKLCANVQPKPCANFTLQATPKPTPASPTPVESPSPSPSGNPPASAVRRNGGGGISGLDIITRPPFVFLPIIGILGLLGVLIYWFLSSRRRPMAPGSASVVHHATRPDYMEPFGSTPRPPVAAPLPPQAPAPASAPPAVPLVQPDPSAAWPLAAAPPRAATPPAATPPAVTPPPAVQRPSAWPLERPPAPVEAPPPPIWPAAPDEPPDLPQPSD